LSEIDIGQILRQSVQARLGELGVESTLVSKNIGYELRCADPTPVDMEYTRDLGYCAAQFLLEGGDAVMISMQGGQFVPIPFRDMLDPTTGRARIRLVDVQSSRYLIARRYMIRLRRRDFEEPAQLARLARAAHLDPQRFHEQFAYVVENEPETLHLRR
jgi:6-phosphofructokinase 1